MVQKDIQTVQSALLNWYKSHGRHDLPWRNLEKFNIALPYGVMVSEFMLQQTQVDRVVPKFTAFVNYFPTVKKLAAAAPAKVTVLWSGLGYNRRAVLLHSAAKEIAVHYSGIIPPDQATLESLPGIGPYTASAILAFGYNLPAVVIDTNIERFYELLFWGYAKPTSKEMRAFVADFIPSEQSRDWHSGIMDLMTEVRRFTSPLEQQKELLTRLDIAQTWPLPVLSGQPLPRPKQTKFHRSPRYFRGQIVAYLRNQPGHQASYAQIKKLMQSLDLPEAYSLRQIVEGLKKDKLVYFSGRLIGATRVSLSPE